MSKPSESRREMPRLQVRDLMTEKVMALRASNNLATAYDLMGNEHVRHIPIVDAEGDLVGLITHRDLLRSGFEEHELPLTARRERLGARKIRDVMTSEVETIAPDADLKEAAQILFENKLGCLPVVEGNRLVGILTESDFVRYFLRDA